MKSNSPNPNLSHAVSLGTIEVGAGSILHAFHIPLSGHFLSLNQAFFLSRSIHLQKDARSPLMISNLAAILKSLSPAGNRLGPMLAISAQGFLFTAGTLAFGANLAGALLGCALLSVWAFAQPLLTYYIFFGATLFKSIDKVLSEFQKVFGIGPKNWWMLLTVLIVIKLLLTFGAGIAAFFVRNSTIEKYQAKLQGLGAQKLLREKGQNSRSVLKDLLNPFFLASLALTVFFAYFTESPFSQIIWIALRPIALCLVFYFLSRTEWVRDRLRALLTDARF